ncbi:hypothetical protein C4D60_Mb08t26790 [Musa balbisiana]|uniref:Uncharacterized protein n=1 Tax=Musa balbisiana TaxID=52838 RepID=A0A4S8K6S7_MUSBA|nr:hypothetical protein C4D60_Mb08t26790 [Musa balbisiana]
MKENLDRERNRETWQMQKTKRLVVGDEMRTPLVSSGNIIIVIATEKASPSPWSSLCLPSNDQTGLLDQLWDDTFCRWASAPRKGPQAQVLLLLLLAAASTAAATGSVVQVIRSITILRTASSSPRAAGGIGRLEAAAEETGAGG